MKNIFSLVLFCLISSSMLFGQVFNYTYIFADDFVEGQAPELESKAYTMVVGSDGSTVSIHNITHGSESTHPDLHDVEILKVDASGDVVWSRRFGGDPYDDQAHALCITDDGGYMVVGSRGKLYENEDEAYRDWIFRLDANGNLLWEQLYVMGETNSECLLVQRTAEADENYFIVGRTFSDAELFGFDEISAKKISGIGQPYWNNIYAVKSNLKEMATSMVPDTRFNGFAIVGQEFVNRKSSTNLFSIGINLDGVVYRKYRNYSLFGFNNETDPHIIENIAGNGFMVAFGSGPAFDQANSTIAMMPLAGNLAATTATLYDADTERNERPNSIYLDADGVSYAMGCNASDDAAIINGSDDRAAFFKVDVSDQIALYSRYNNTTNANCPFMAQDLANQNYILKTDMTLNYSPAAGIIRTDLNGESACSVSREVMDPVVQNVSSRRRKHQVLEAGTPFQFASEQWEMDTYKIDCDELADQFAGEADQRDNDESENTKTSDLANSNLTAYPNVLGNDRSEFTLEFTAEMDQDIMIQILSTQGQLVEQLNCKAMKGTNRLQVNADKLQLGVNTILLINKDKTSAYTRMIKF